jgi:hypothetical protein
MSKVQIMVLGKNEQDITPILNELNNTDEWEVNAFTDKEAAVNYFQQGDRDVVVFSKEIAASEKQGLGRLFQFQERNIILLNFNHEKTIWTTVNDALYQREINMRPIYSIVDNALRHAKFNICLN